MARHGAVRPRCKAVEGDSFWLSKLLPNYEGFSALLVIVCVTCWMQLS